MNLLIIGCNGFIGCSLSNYFLKIGWQVSGCDTSDLFNPAIDYFKTNLESEGLSGFLQSKSIEVCINASGSSSIGSSFEDPMADFNSNAYTVYRILNLLRLMQPQCRYLHISSAAVIGNPDKLPIEESHRCNPISPYGYHKWIAEIICKQYHHLYKTRIAIVRPFSAYGPGQKKQLLWDICSKLKISDDVLLYGKGNESRDFIHVHDLARLIHCVIVSGNFSGDIFNGGTGIETTISNIAKLFMSFYRGKKKLSFSGESRTGDPINWRADASRLKAIGFSPSIDLNEGIREYIKWFEEL